MNKLQAAKVAIEAEIFRATRSFVDTTYNRIVERYTAGTGPASLASRSGALVGGVRKETVIGPPVTGRVYMQRSGESYNPFYAIVHEEGRTIRPKRAKYLRFQIDGRWVFAKQVVIPARPIWATTAHEMLPLYEHEVQKSVDRICAIISKTNYPPVGA
jgi:hypothetical protein